MKTQNVNCDKCNIKIITKKEEIINGYVLVFEANNQKYSTVRCKECYKEDKTLTKYQLCEVYDRVVGYLRPVSQWNIGKKQEFKERKKYKLKVE